MRYPNTEYHVDGWTLRVRNKLGMKLIEGTRDSAGNLGIGISGLTHILNYREAEWSNYTVTPEVLTPLNYRVGAAEGAGQYVYDLDMHLTYHIYPVAVSYRGLVSRYVYNARSPYRTSAGTLAALVYAVSDFKPETKEIDAMVFIREHGHYYEELLGLLENY